MGCIEKHFISSTRARADEWRAKNGESFEFYRKQKGRQSMMSTRDDEPF